MFGYSSSIFQLSLWCVQCKSSRVSLMPEFLVKIKFVVAWVTTLWRQEIEANSPWSTGLGDQSWVYYYQIGTKRAEKARRYSNHRNSDKFSTQTSGRKVMLTLSCDHQDHLVVQYKPKGTTAICASYCNLFMSHLPQLTAIIWRQIRSSKFTVIHLKPDISPNVVDCSVLVSYWCI